VEHTRLKGKAPGATAHEYLKTLAIARLALDNFAHLQASWPTLGFKVAQAALYYGADDFGSTMLEENVVRAAGVNYRVPMEEIVHCIKDAGFTPAQRNTRYEILREF
jgi:2-iminoacetate synthase ThiH